MSLTNLSRGRIIKFEKKKKKSTLRNELLCFENQLNPFDIGIITIIITIYDYKSMLQESSLYSLCWELPFFFECLLNLKTRCLIQGDKRTCCGCTLTLQYLKQRDSEHKAFNLGQSFICDFR
jgi:hypothetical protein